MTAPIIPEDLVYPVRGEDRVLFANKANTFNQRLVEEVVPQLNSLGVWTNDQAVSVANDVLLTQQYSADSINASVSASTSANNAASLVQTVLDSQTQANALLGAGIGTSYLQDGDLYITYVEATVNNVLINQDGLLVIETV